MEMKNTIIARKCKDCWYYGITVRDKYHKREWCYWKGAYVCGSSEECSDGYIDRKQWMQEHFSN